MNRLVVLVERFGGCALAVIAALTFVSVLLRYLANAPVPDAFDFSRLLMGIVILWGVAGASYYGEHIRFDAIWTMLGRRARRILDVIADLVTLIALSVLTVMLAIRVEVARDSFVTTSGLGLELWPFYAVAWIGSAVAVVLLMARLYRLIVDPAGVPSGDPDDRV